MHVQWRPDLFTLPEELYPEELFSELVKNRELYVAKMGGTVVGYCWLRMRVSDAIGRVPRKIMLIDQLCVDEALRNHGIGTQMMEEVRVLARAFGCTDMQLGVYPQNDEAVSFYQKCGFMIRSIDMQRKV
jgi:ribosomal protein S18 acetylase RimI-like enzyme